MCDAGDPLLRIYNKPGERPVIKVTVAFVAQNGEYGFTFGYVSEITPDSNTRVDVDPRDINLLTGLLRVYAGFLPERSGTALAKNLIRAYEMDDAYTYRPPEKVEDPDGVTIIFVIFLVPVSDEDADMPDLGLYMCPDCGSPLFDIKE